MQQEFPIRSQYSQEIYFAPRKGGGNAALKLLTRGRAFAARWLEQNGDSEVQVQIGAKVGEGCEELDLEVARERLPSD